ncbi:MAG TPA: hypothetical protein VF796_16045 [Humisphaera sp.]
MHRRRRAVLATAAALAAGVAVATGVAAAAPASPATKPATRPAAQPATQPATEPADPRSLSSDQLMNQMLRPGPGGQPRPIQPVPAPPTADVPGVAKPKPPAVAKMREGTYLPERVGRLTRSADGSRAEFVFEVDGHDAAEPPIIVHPNLKLMLMENAVSGTNRDGRFRVAGVITEYGGHNYLLVDQATEPPARPAAASPVAAPATRPSTRPEDPRALSADELFTRMLRTGPDEAPRQLRPAADVPTTDRTSGRGAVKPNAPVVTTMREGRYLPERVARLSRSADGSQAELVFESDGHAMKDPPVVILPNLKLTMMENMVAGSNRDLRFRVSGVITEYRGRNYILIEKVTVPPEQTTQF